MRQNIWIWNHYATNTFKDKGGRHYWFAENLINVGYKPTIFCASTIHNTDESIDTKGRNFINNSINNIPYVFIKTPEYTGNGKKRILNMLSFYRRLFAVSKEYVKLNGKPDVILASSVHPLTLVAGIKIAKKFGVPCICEVRDLWPESLVAYGSLKRNSIIAKILYKGEKWIYTQADKLIFTMEGGKDYIVEQGWDEESRGSINISKVYHINNGVDLETYNYNKEHYQIKDEDLDNPDIFKVVYTGSVRLVNKVELLVEAAKQLKDLNVKFLVWGDGDQVENINKRIQNEKLSNIILKGKVNKNYIPYILSKADLNIILGETSNFFRFGISPNKLFEYFASGKPVLQTFMANYSIVEKNNAGVELVENTHNSIAQSVKFFLKMEKSDYQKYCESSLALSKEFNYEKLTNKLIRIIETYPTI